jgi:3-mercaptopyruvate sulfurtransferase SseA
MKMTWKKHNYARTTVVCLLSLCLLLPSCTTEPSSESSQTAVQQTPEVQTISTAALKKKIDDGNSLVLLDVRTTDRYDASHIEKAISIPFRDIPDRYQEIPQGREIIVYTSCA